MSPTRAALEAALATDPDDAARHAAYADLLIEEGDPRGEFIRLSLALESDQLSNRQRAACAKEWRSLLGRYEAEWLGPLGRFARTTRPSGRPAGETPTVARWRRGWLEALSISDLTPDIAVAACRSPAVRLLRTLHVAAPDMEVSTTEHLVPLFAALGHGPLSELKFGYGPGDELIDVLIATGILARLRVLHLGRCRLTDDGASLIARHIAPEILQELDLSYNHITPLGATALAEVGYPNIGPQEFGHQIGAAYV